MTLLDRTIPPPFRVVIDGVDYSKYVVTINNSFTLGDPDATSSTVELKADTAQGNIELMRKIIAHCNEQSPAKIYKRGYYSLEEKLRVEGYCTSVTGTNPFSGCTILIAAIPSSLDNPKEDTKSSDPFIDKSVTQIVKELIKRWGYAEGKIDQFDQTIGAWYPGNRTFTDALMTLADSVGAMVSIDLKPLEINSNGALRIDGAFDIKDETTIITPSDAIRFISPARGDDVTYEEAGEKTFIIDTESASRDETELRDLKLVPVPRRLQVGPGKDVMNGEKGEAIKPIPGLHDDNGFYYSADNQFKSAAQKAAEDELKKKFDPYIIDKLRGANIKAYLDEESGKITQYITVVDNGGRELLVPLDVAIATAKSRKVVNFVYGNEMYGMLGQSGIILTLRNGEEKFPYLRVRDISGFEYRPTVSKLTGRLSPAAMDGSSGASKAAYKSAELRLKPQGKETVAAIANDPQYSGAFKTVVYRGKKYYIAYDPEALRIDKVTKQAVPLAPKPGADGTTPTDNTRMMRRDEFDALNPEQVYDIYMKRRAQVFNNDEDTFIRTFYKDIADFKAKMDADDSGDQLMPDGKTKKYQYYYDTLQKALEHERQNNPYVKGAAGREDGDDSNIYDSSNLAPPVFMGSERWSDYLPEQSTEETGADAPIQSITFSGPEVGQRIDGKSPLLKANTIHFNPATGANIRGQYLEKDEWPFSMSVSINSAVELSVGFKINADETFGPFMGPYTLHSLSETLTSSGDSQVLGLQTQAYMDGYGRQMNSAQNQAASNPNANGQGGVNTGTLIPSDAPRPVGSEAGIKIVEMARAALNSDWSARKPGMCSAFVRATIEHAYGVRSSIDEGGAFSGIFGASAKKTGENARRAGIMTAYDPATLRAGDIIVIETGSGGYGHIGIWGGDGYVYENSWRNGKNAPDGRLRTPAEVFLKETPTGVIRAEDMDKWAKAHGGK